MSLQDLNQLEVVFKDECLRIMQLHPSANLSADFMQTYSQYLTDKKPDGYGKALWKGMGNVEITTTAGNLLFVSSTGFYFAAGLIPVYNAIKQYHDTVQEALEAEGYAMDVVFASENELKKKRKLKANIDFESFVQASTIIAPEDKNAVLHFLKDDGWWHDGKALHRSDYFVSPLLSIGNLQGATQSYIAVITKQLAENPNLYSLLLEQGTLEDEVRAPYAKTEIREVSQAPISDFSDFIKQLEDDIRGAGLVYADGLMRRFVCAQLAKPFVVLTGLSGSGKTKLAQAFTEWIAVENTAKIVPVGADWTNSEKMLGYPNALDPDKYVLPDTGVLKLMLDARDNPGLPFFLILDEMNLSHVERYFADFLSTMESEGTIKLYDGKARLADDGTPVPSVLEWPKNLFVIGTMNVDETTYMFSPKVLDRAQVIEFRVAKKAIADFLDAPKAPDMKSLKEKGAAYAAAFLKLAEKRKEKKPAAPELATVKTALVGMFEELEKLGSEFAFRSAGEIVNFIAYYLEASGYGTMPAGTDRQKCLTAAIDAAVVQKLLPKLHGSLNRLSPVLDALIEKSVKKIQPANDPDADPVLQIVYALTYEKLLRMKERVEKNGFTSFAEA